MSDSSIGLKPVIEEPSKPIPPSKASSSSEELIEKLFSCPRTSVNQRRMKRTSCSLDGRDHVVGGLRALGLDRRIAQDLSVTSRALRIRSEVERSRRVFVLETPIVYGMTYVKVSNWLKVK